MDVFYMERMDVCLYGLYGLNGLNIAELYSVLLHSIVVTYLVRMTNPDKYMASAGIFAT